MCAMDLKHHDVPYSNGGRPKGPSVIKSEPRSRSPCYSQGREVIRSPPIPSSSSGLFNGIASSKRLRPPDDWLTPRSPVTVSLAVNSGSIAVSASNLSSSPGPGLHSVYPSTSNGYPSPTMSTSSYDPYNSGSKLSGEDLSPNSQNGYLMDVCDANKKKKGPTATTRQQEELCLVCGDRASGYHYNALTCEGCKGFFRRSITKNAVYQCKYGNDCDIDMYMRRKCQECRLKKCLSVGMRPECVVPEYQCAVKRKEKKAQKDKDKPNSTTNGSPGTIKIEPELQRVDCDPLMVNGVKPVSNEQEELIHSLVYFQEQYEQPSPDDLQRVFSNAEEIVNHGEGDMKYRHITEMTILTVQLIVEFAKSLPGFDKLLREDQITLLKACSSEVMMLRMARKYDSNTDSIVFANNQPYTKDSYNDAGMGETIEDLLRFCRQMWAVKVDNAEYALLTAIVIFSGRPALVEDWKVEKIQEVYIETLKSYVDNRVRPNSTTIFARLLSVLTELRTLGNRNFEMCLTLKLKSKVLPPFLSEIWDVAS